jgi:hypothetical protein
MLTCLKKDETERLREALNAHPGFNVRVSALIKAYGVGQTFFNVWHQNFDTVLARLEGSFFICEGEKADFEEIALFLGFNPYFRRLVGKADAVAKIAAYLTVRYERRRFDFFEFRAGKPDGFRLPDICGQPVIDASPGLADVYSVMEKAESADFAVGDFTPWYADLSHRIRHGCARAYLLKVGELSASACLVSVESDSAGLLSGVATIPQFRSRGFAAAVVRRARSDLAFYGKLPVLECLPSLASYYCKQGFDKSGKTEELVLF